MLKLFSIPSFRADGLRGFAAAPPARGPTHRRAKGLLRIQRRGEGVPSGLLSDLLCSPPSGLLEENFITSA